MKMDQVPAELTNLLS